MEQVPVAVHGAVSSYSAKSSQFTAVAADRGTFFDCTGSFTLDLTAAATLGSGWSMWVRVISGTITIDPASTELINGASTYAISNAGDVVLVECTGSAFVVGHMQLPSSVAVTGGTINNTTIGATTATTGRFTTVESTIATGTAPFTVASTTVVGNLNVSQLLGSTWAAPGTIGSTTPNTGVFLSVGIRDSANDHTITIDTASDEGADRSITIPAMGGNRTLPLLELTQSWSGVNTFSNATASTSTSTGAIVISTGGVGVGGQTTTLNLGVGSRLTSIWHDGGIDPAAQVIGTTDNTSSLALARFQAAATAAPLIMLGRSRGTSVGSYTIVQNGDRLGAIFAYGSDGTDLSGEAASIVFAVDGTPADGDIPGSIFFQTKAAAGSQVTHLTIGSAGGITAGTSATLTLSKTTGTTLVVSSTQAASSGITGCATFAGGIGVSKEIWVGLDASAGSFNINGPAASARGFAFYTAASARWTFRAGTTAESGSDAGTQFEIVARNDSGTQIDVPITIIRASTGAITITRQLIGSASTTARATLRVPHGTAPTSPVDGDMWTTTTGLFVRINGSTVGPLS